MNEELVPADTSFLPIGSIIPFLRGEVPDGWLELNGDEILWSECPELHNHFERHLSGEGLRLWEGWGGVWAEDPHPEESHILILPKLDRDQVVQMLWGVKYEQAPDVVLAIKASRDYDEPSS